jgi:fimbrial isopeptide formation D2 family protein/LPXTG-motif cell wall-anchored protein
MKQIKRIMAFALALVLTLAMSITVFADEQGSGAQVNKPYDGETATITVNNVDSGLEVKAYQYVDADYNGSGLVGYHVVDEASDYVKNYDADNITAEEILDLSKNYDGLKATELSYDESSKAYTANVEAGSYLILVTGSGAKIYNPMVVSVFYNIAGSGSDNTLIDGSVSADGNWNLKGKELYAKSATPSVTKEIVSVTSSEPNSTPDKDDDRKLDAAVDDTVTFQITTKIPAYSSEYVTGENFIFQLDDTMDAGFTYNSATANASVTIDGKIVDGAKVEQDESNNQKLVINLSNVALNHVGEDVVVTYSATLNDSADKSVKNGVVANKNEVVLTYSTSPNKGDIGTAKDETSSYTYKIDSLITKVDENENPLSGATFTLTGGDGNHTYTEISNEKGIVNFTGLDAGEYTLKETAAPDKYSLNNTTYKVTIKPVYVAGEVTDVEITFDDSEGAIKIQDTLLASLPSTGGIGTTIFTIAGCLIMITAAGMYFASRRRSAK